ncbi:polB [Caudoviricetes sp.]|nr:polB [Caudoviricetes sp.]UOF81859.1 polB [Caudoviricetes sp.]
MQARTKRGQTYKKPNILTLDIETAPLSAYTWGLWEQNIGLDMVKNDWRILSVAWKWLGHKTVHFESAEIVRGEVNDARLLQTLYGMLDHADIVVTQNGLDFDIKRINARLVEAGYSPYTPVRHIDTKRVAKQVFGFTSNRLEWMGERIAGVVKDKHRKFPGFELWRECLAGNLAAWAEMEKYNKRDVLATEALYLKLRPWIPNHHNVAVYREDGVLACPRCGCHGWMQKRGKTVTNGGVYTRLVCGSCGGWSRMRAREKVALPPSTS